MFLKHNDNYSSWNLGDKQQLVYFLSRMAMKEPKDFIEKEIQEKKIKDEQYLYRPPVLVTRLLNEHV